MYIKLAAILVLVLCINSRFLMASATHGPFETSKISISQSDLNFKFSSSTSVPSVSQYDLFANYSGDILLAGFFPIHNRNDSNADQSCGDLNLIDGPHTLESMMFALDTINSRPNFLRFKLGAIALDSCVDPDRALNQAVTILFPTSNGRRAICADGQPPVPQNSKFDHSSIVGVVGGMTSDVSISLANVLRVYKVPQISYYATTDSLSKVSKFPYFLRTVPSDADAIKALIELLEYFNWNYINVIHDSSMYSMNARDLLENQLSKRVKCTCIQSKIYVDESKPYTFRNLLSQLSSEPKSENDTPLVNTIVLLLTHDVTLKLFNILRDNSMFHLYNWIGVTGWTGRYMNEEKNMDILTNLITIEPTMIPLPGFKEYLKQQRPSLTKRNPWLKFFFEKVCECSYNLYQNETGSCYDFEEECALKVFDNYKQMNYDQFIVNAVYAFAYALEKLQNKICKDDFQCKLSAANFTGSQLIDTLRHIKFNDYTGQHFQFENRIDGPVKYSIFYNINGTWIVGGRYVKPEGSHIKTFILTDKFKRMKGTVYKPSKCNRKCNLDESTLKIRDSKCCWTCLKCGAFDIVKRDLNFFDSFIPSSKCIICKPGTRPLTNRTSCENITVESISPNKTVSIIVILISTVGIILTLIITGIFIFYHSTPIIKASGRETSSILLSGILLSYITPILMVMEPTDFICTVTYVSPGMCATICYAAILAKTNRIARIFHTAQQTKKKKVKFTSPLSQIYIVSTMILAEMIILLILVIMEKPTLNLKQTNTINQLLCSTMKGQTILVTGMMFPVILLILSTMYAFKIRKTPDGFNETSSLCFLNYANTALYIICLPLVYVFKDNIYWSLPMCCLLCCSATSQLFGIFVTKLYIVLLRPEKNTHKAVMNRTRTQSQLSGINNCLTNRQFSTVSKINESTEGSVSHHPSLDSGITVTSTISDSIDEDPFTSRSSTLASRQTTFSILDNEERLTSSAFPQTPQKSVSFDATADNFQSASKSSQNQKTPHYNQVSPQSSPELNHTYL